MSAPRAGRLRIVAGELKGRRIELPPEASFRPTADRVREALFSILGTSVREARVLDAYCGSGALGFEALSRGAAHVVFVENDRRALDALHATAARLGVSPRSVVHAGPAVAALESRALAGPFDLVLADPPYGSGEPARFLPWAGRVLAPGGTVVVERDRRDATVSGGGMLVCCRTAGYGRVRLDFYRSPG